MNKLLQTIGMDVTDDEHISIDTITKDTRAFIEMWKNCYNGDDPGMWLMWKDWLRFYTDSEQYEAAANVQRMIVAGGQDPTLIDHEPLTIDMAALYRVCLEIVDMEYDHLALQHARRGAQLYD